MNDSVSARRLEVTRDWEARGHGLSACLGHTYPLPDCPAPAVHAEVFPPDQALTLDRVLAALRAVFNDLDSTGRAGDEWAYEWVQETWKALVPLQVRAAAGDRDAAEELKADPLEQFTPGVQGVFRVQCTGACKGYLRNGRVTPPHWGPMYAEIFASRAEAHRAALDAGWIDGRCPADEAAAHADGCMKGPGHTEPCDGDRGQTV